MGSDGKDTAYTAGYIVKRLLIPQMIKNHAQARGSFTIQASLDEAFRSLFLSFRTRSFPFTSFKGQDDNSLSPDSFDLSFTHGQTCGSLPCGLSLDTGFHWYGYYPSPPYQVRDRLNPLPSRFVPHTGWL
jgi:hypothetical protein